METTDLAQFKKLEYNRELTEGHVLKIMDVLSEPDFDTHPISVTEDLEVIDGQHRLEAAKRLGIPVKYVIDKNFRPEKIITINTCQKGWKPLDYLHIR